MPGKLFTLLLVFSFTFHVQAQDADSTGRFVLENIDTWKLHASNIGEDYTIYVLKTADYDTTNKKYDVLYMTDGDWNMTVAMNCFSMLRQDYSTHEPIVVGIGYGKNENKRVRDLNPETGAAAFTAFIENEVMPFINKKYRTTDERAIYGYSMGGMYTTYLLFNRADLFQKIFIGAPGNNGTQLMPAARKYFQDHNDLRSNVFIGVGSYETMVVKSIDSFVTFLQSKKLPGLRLRSDITPAAGHGAGLAAVMQNAIAFGYCDRYAPVQIDKKLFKKYSGRYVYYENGKQEAVLDIYSRNGKLLMKWNDAYASDEELFAVSNNEFYTPTNERMLFRFEEKDLTVEMYGKPYKLIKE